MRTPFLIALLTLAGAAPASATPRVISLDYCADQFLLELADRDQIIAVSPGADDDYSYLRGKAKGIPRMRPDAEAIAPKRPDVVLRFWGGDPRLTRLLEKSGARVVTLDYSSDFDDVRANIRTASQALGRQQRGKALIEAMDARLAALKGKGSPDISALYVTPGGVTAGTGTMIDAIITAAGTRNAAAQAGLSGWPPLPAENLILDPPEFIIAGFFNVSSETANHWSAARHPAFRKLFAATLTLRLSADVLSCPAWFSVDAAEAIAAAVTKGQAHDSK